MALRLLQLPVSELPTAESQCPVEGQGFRGSLRSPCLAAPQGNLGAVHCRVHKGYGHEFPLAGGGPDFCALVPLGDTPVGPMETEVRDLGRAQPGGQVVSPAGP